MDSQELFSKVIDKYNKEYKYHHEWKPLTNIRLQKLCFLVYVEELLCGNKDNVKKINFYTWTYGPVEPEIYSQYSIFKKVINLPLIPAYKFKYNEKLDATINSILQRTGDLTDQMLIDAQADKNALWNEMYNLSKNTTNLVQVDKVLQYYKDPKNYDTLFCTNTTSMLSQPE